MYDVVIIGAGPAGSTLARLLAPVCRTLLVERREAAARGAQSAPGKCCGGLLAPDAQAMLARLGLGLPHHVLVGPQIFAVRAVDLASGRERHYQRFYLNMDRALFDAWLVSLVPASVERRHGATFRTCHVAGDHVEATLRHAQGLETVKTRLLVGADGAWSAVRRAAFPSCHTAPAYVAMQEWFRAESAAPCFSALFDPAITDHYCWLIPKGDLLVAGAALRPGRAAPERFERFKTRLPSLGVNVQDSVRRESTMLLRPRCLNHIHAGTGRIALIGEAGGWISPSSSEGFSYAMHSALLLARALASQGPAHAVKRYNLASLGLRVGIGLKNLKARAIANRPLRVALMAAGVLSLDIEPDM